MKMKNLIERINSAGIENCLFLIPMRPLRNYFGIIGLTSSDDPETMVPARIIEDRHKVAENYKIELKSDYEIFGKKRFYVSSLESLIKNGKIQFFVLANHQEDLFEEAISDEDQDDLNWEHA